MISVSSTPAPQPRSWRGRAAVCDEWKQPHAMREDLDDDGLDWAVSTVLWAYIFVIIAFWLGSNVSGIID